MNEMRNKLRFKSFMEFCDRADELRETFALLNEYRKININNYKRYLYRCHKFSENRQRDIMIKDKCWTWLLSYKYEPMTKSDLFSVLGYIKDENEVN